METRLNTLKLVNTLVLAVKYLALTRAKAAMKSTLNAAGFAFLLLTLAGPSNAGIATGTFTGTVYGAWGTVDGFDLTDLDGQSIIGTFTYDPAALLSSGGTDGATHNMRYQYSPTVPVTITQTISYQSSEKVFTSIGDSFSEVYAGRNYPAQPGEYTDWLYIQASGGVANTNGTYIYLANTLGRNYLSNVQDLGSINFSNLPSETIGNSTFGLDSNHPNTGGYSFTIESSTGVGVIAVPPGTAPEPATLALVAAALLGAVATRRRNSSVGASAVRVASRLRPLTLLLFLAGVLDATSNASAGLIAASDSSFSWTTDTTTGLDWLSFDGGAAPSTVFRSKDAVAAQLGSGGEYAGWRFATNAEVYQFVLDVTGFPYLVAVPSTSSVNNGATSMVATWTGYTGQQGQTDNINTVLGFTVEGYAGLLDRDSALFADYTLWIPYVGPLNTNEPYDEIGSWLVRGGNQPGPTVPEPATIALVCAALLGIVASRRRKPTRAVVRL